jgi:NAD(P)H-flavin reductase
MFSLLKTFFLAIIMLPNILSFSNDMFSINYSINNKQIYFTLETDIIPSRNWWIGIGLQKEQKNIDTIVYWNNNINDLNITVLNLQDFNNISSLLLLDNYIKDDPYLSYKNIIIKNNKAIIEFSRVLNTYDKEDIQFDRSINTINIIFAKGNTLFPSNPIYFYNLTENININITINNNNTNNNRDFNLEMFYPSIFTFFIYFIFLFFCILTQTTRIKCLNKNIYTWLFGYRSIGMIIFTTSYLIWWISMCVYSLLGDNSSQLLFRLGVWIMLNTSNMLLPITRNSIWLYLFKIPYLKIIHLHRFMALLCIVSVIIKFIVVLLLYPPEFLIVLLNKTTGGSPIAGTISTFCYIILGIFSIKYVRKNCFETFYFTHRIFSLLAIATSIWHYLTSLYYLIPSLLLYILDIICRYINIHKGIYLKLENIGDIKYNTSCIVLSIKVNKNFNTYPGCYFLICIKNISSLEWHPISLIDNKNNRLIFCAKDMGEGTWTGKIRQLNLNSQETVDELFNKEVYLQGPYGNINLDYSKYKSIVTIAGGIGITSILSILSHINELIYLKKINNLQNILFIWIIPHTSLLDYFNKYIIHLDHEITDINIFVTKQEQINDLPIYIKFEKPNIKNELKKYREQKMLYYNDIAIITCGPERLITDVKNISNELNIDLFCEDF